MLNFKTVLIQFYKPVFIINLFFSLFLIYKSNLVGYLPSLAFKLGGYGVLIGWQYFSKSNTYYYFRNAGYSIRRLYVYSIILDLFIYSTLCLFFYLLHELTHP